MDELLGVDYHPPPNMGQIASPTCNWPSMMSTWSIREGGGPPKGGGEKALDFD